MQAVNVNVMRLPGLLMVILGVMLLVSAMPGDNDIADQFYLDAVAHRHDLPVFNYGAKMAAVDQRPYKPGDPTFAHSILFYSQSSDTAAHGGKIFRLRVKDDNNYAYNNIQPAGQLIIMPTWYGQLVRTNYGDNETTRINDSMAMRITTPSDFYIMYKSNADEYATDSGWVYGVVSADGKRVLQKGVVSTCVNCHRLSKTDRIFGAR